ncbi:MAG: hypothetical protein PGN37_05925 [Mycobacterium kyogaense]
MSEPFDVAAGAVNLRVSASASVAVTVPVTAPVAVLGLLTVAVAFVGAAFAPPMVTETMTGVSAPWPSAAVTTKVSVVADAGALSADAACRAAVVGV